MSIRSEDLELFPEAQSITEIGSALSKEAPISNSPLEIINPNTDGGLTRLQEVSRTAEINTLVFKAEEKELRELAHDMRATPSDPTKLTRQFAEGLANDSGIPVDDIYDLLSAGSLVPDIEWLSKEVDLHGQSRQIIVQEAVWLYDQKKNLLTKSIGHEGDVALLRSRMSGLVPFSMLDWLQTARIRCAGASAVAMSIDALAALGCEDMKWWDGGTIDRSNDPRFPLGMASYHQVGRPKATSLEEYVRDRAPFGRFFGYKGIVLPDHQQLGSNDVSYTDIAKDCDILVEVVDNPWAKAQIREMLADQFPNLLVVYLADVNNAFVGIERPGDRNHFNQNLDPKEFERLTSIPNTILVIPDTQERNDALNKEALRSVTQMLGSETNFPPEHQLQFLARLKKLVPFWSQTSAATHTSAALVSELIPALAQRKDIIGKNYTKETIPHPLVPEFTVRQRNTLRKIMNQIFSLA